MQLLTVWPDYRNTKNTLNKNTLNKKRYLFVAFIAVLLIWVGVGNSVAREPVTSFLELREKNVVLQEWDLSCGAAALTTLLRYQHGVDVTEKEVATELIGRKEYLENPELLKIKQGFSLLDLKRYVDKRGFLGEGYGGLTMENLIALAPVLIPINLDGYNHFVIFRGVAGKRVLVADPAWGNRVMKKDTFLQSWIDFDDLGRVGFVVEPPEGRETLTSLLPTALDFVMIR